MSRKSPQNIILRALGRKKAVAMKELKGADYAINRAIRNVLDTGLAEELDSGQGQYLRLTEDGKRKLASIELSEGQMPIPAAWDGKWRVIILDLPESRKNEREALRYLLKKAGFQCVKNTVWVSPYPFEHLFINIKKDLGLTTEIMILVTDNVDEETVKIFKK